jgi:prepilin-type N-terminal cleavage/methylation domain-containing protein
MNALRKSAFTLIEILIAVAIMSLCMALVAMIYTNTIKAWRMGQNVMDELHQGDFVMEQIVSALRSEAFFPNNRQVYGFWLDDKGTQSSAHDEISFVTSSSAFLPSDSQFQNSLHRLFLTIDSDSNGREGLAVRALPHMAKEMKKNEAPVWIVSTRVKSLDCQVYDMGKKDWEDDWEDTNKIPNLVKVTITVSPVHEEDPDLVISRVVEIPIAPAVTQAVAVTTGAAAGGTNNAAGTVPVGGVGIGGINGGRNTGLPNSGRGGSSGSQTGSGRNNNPGRSGGGFGGGSTRNNPTPLPPNGPRR